MVQPVVLGIASAIASVILLALAGVMIKSQLSQRDPITLNALQSVVASLLFLGVFLLVPGRLDGLSGLPLPSLRFLPRQHLDQTRSVRIRRRYGSE